MTDNAPSCSVRESGIHGLGLFADKWITMGEIVAQYNVWDETQWEKVPFNKVKAGEWVLGLTETMAVRPTVDSKFFHANHSRTPNCNWLRDRQCLVANRMIFEGDEITYDYRLDIHPPGTATPFWA